MMPWHAIVGHGLWIAGLAVLLASFSQWLYLRARLAAGDRILMQGGLADLGLMLIVTGLATTSSDWLERGLWGLIGLLVLGRRWYSQRQSEPP
jgi:hypothetical protein